MVCGIAQAEATRRKARAPAARLVFMLFLGVTRASIDLISVPDNPANRYLVFSAAKVGTACAFRNSMLTYAYQARDSSGKTVSGVQEALNEDNAVNTLMSRGLMVLSLQQKAAGKAMSGKGKITETDLVLFTRQLATMVDAGLPLVSGLTALYEQADPKRQAGLRRAVG